MVSYMQRILFITRQDALLHFILRNNYELVWFMYPGMKRRQKKIFTFDKITDSHHD
jgi:hypothetical protein